MNYLAHLALAPDSAADRIGNLAGDFVRPGQLQTLPPAMHAGYALHFAIDRYTDQHPQVAASKARIAPPRRRWAGILVDIFYDHFLACHWPRWHSQPLPAFAQQVYRELSAETALPPRLAAIVPQMQRDNWLLAYRDIDGIAAILRAFALYRARRGNPVAEGIIDLSGHYHTLEQDFLAFYPQLLAHVAGLSGNP